MLYCKVDPGDPREDLLVELADTAEAKLLAGGARNVKSTALQFKLAVKALTLHWLDNPTGTQIPAGLQTQINELKNHKGG